MGTGIMHQCVKEKCLYQWEGRTESPKACPRCKVRLDNPHQQGNGLRGVKLPEPVNKKSILAPNKKDALMSGAELKARTLQ